jgi:ribosomal-protein-alanine N-acetyltransferase
MNYNLKMRSMQAADLARILEIENLAYSFPWTLSLFKDCLRFGYTAEVLVLEQIIAYGFMSIAADEAQILNIGVHPKWQGCGYGGQMLERLLDIANLKGVQSVFLEVRISNQTAIHLYDKIGFKQIGIRRDYYRNGDKGREDALVLAMEMISDNR